MKAVDCQFGPFRPLPYLHTSKVVRRNLPPMDRTLYFCWRFLIVAVSLIMLALYSSTFEELNNYVITALPSAGSLKDFTPEDQPAQTFPPLLHVEQESPPASANVDTDVSDASTSERTYSIPATFHPQPPPPRQRRHRRWQRQPVDAKNATADAFPPASDPSEDINVGPSSVDSYSPDFPAPASSPTPSPPRTTSKPVIELLLAPQPATASDPGAGVSSASGPPRGSVPQAVSESDSKPESAPKTLDTPPTPVPHVPPIRGLHLTPQKELELRGAVSCMSTGEWVKNSTPRPLPWTPENYFGICDTYHVANHTGGIFGEKADRVATEGGEGGQGEGLGGESGWNVRPSLKWEWHVKGGCRWKHFERIEMCRLLDRVGNILLVGDSIQNELERSIYNALYMRQPENDPPTGWPQEEYPDWNDTSKTVRYQKPFSFCHMSLLYEEQHSEEFKWLAEGWTRLGRGREGRAPREAEERSKMRFVRNDHVSLLEKPIENEAPWFHKIREWDIRVLVLNTGAHPLQDEEFKSNLEKTFEALSKTYPEVVVIYRDTPQGHANCMNYDEPAPPDPKVPLPEWFHWDWFPHQNVISKRIVENSGGIFFDIASIAKDRPDGHAGMKGDCLHYCIPGPIDTWVQVLFNVFDLILNNA